MTAGPTGFELASMFYLTKTITMWRHFAMKWLMNGLSIFILASGITLFVKFIKDAKAGAPHVVVLNMAPTVDAKSSLDQNVHMILAFVCLGSFVCAGLFLWNIRHQHL